jgi:soluble lytic murein transglycosylase-like protein
VALEDLLKQQATPSDAERGFRREDRVPQIETQVPNLDVAQASPDIVQAELADVGGALAEESLRMTMAAGLQGIQTAFQLKQMEEAHIEQLRGLHNSLTANQLLLDTSQAMSAIDEDIAFRVRAGEPAQEVYTNANELRRAKKAELAEKLNSNLLATRDGRENELRQKIYGGVDALVNEKAQKGVDEVNAIHDAKYGAEVTRQLQSLGIGVLKGDVSLAQAIEAVALLRDTPLYRNNPKAQETFTAIEDSLTENAGKYLLGKNDLDGLGVYLETPPPQMTTQTYAKLSGLHASALEAKRKEEEKKRDDYITTFQGAILDNAIALLGSGQQVDLQKLRVLAEQGSPTVRAVAAGMLAYPTYVQETLPRLLGATEEETTARIAAYKLKIPSLPIDKQELAKQIVEYAGKQATATSTQNAYVDALKAEKLRQAENIHNDRTVSVRQKLDVQYLNGIPLKPLSDGDAKQLSLQFQRAFASNDPRAMMEALLPVRQMNDRSPEGVTARELALRQMAKVEGGMTPETYAFAEFLISGNLDDVTATKLITQVQQVGMGAQPGFGGKDAPPTWEQLSVSNKDMTPEMRTQLGFLRQNMFITKGESARKAGDKLLASVYYLGAQEAAASGKTKASELKEAGIAKVRKVLEAQGQVLSVSQTLPSSNPFSSPTLRSVAAPSQIALPPGLQATNPDDIANRFNSWTRAALSANKLGIPSKGSTMKVDMSKVKPDPDAVRLGTSQARSTKPKLQQYESYIREQSEKYGLDPALAMAVISIESTGNPDAKSPAGAEGLMQLMPATARGLGVTNSFDPKENIRGGIEYLAKNLKTYGGDLVKTLASYNAGPGAVSKYGGVPPYEETQAYVQKGYAAYQEFKQSSAAVVGAGNITKMLDSGEATVAYVQLPGSYTVMPILTFTKTGQKVPLSTSDGKKAIPLTRIIPTTGG